ncbi:unnamed protein product [Boreogadus saida]
MRGASPPLERWAGSAPVQGAKTSTLPSERPLAKRERGHGADHVRENLIHRSLCPGRPCWRLVPGEHASLEEAGPWSQPGASEAFHGEEGDSPGMRTPGVELVEDGG